MSDLPPQDREAERGVLGAVLLGGSDALDLAREHGLRGEHFYEPAHEVIWEAMDDLGAQGRPIDRTSLVASLSAEQKRAIGNPQLIVDLVTSASLSLSLLEVHAQTVVHAAVLRALRAAGGKIQDLASTAPLDRSREALERSRVALDGVEVPEEQGSISSAADLIPEIIDAMEDQNPRGIPTGIGDLDRLLGSGMGRGQTIVVGARPSIGKSMLGVNLAAVAASKGTPTIVFSHEMTKHELMQRLLSRESGVALTKVRSGRGVDEDEWDHLARASSRIATWPLLIDDQSTMTVADYRARLRQLSKRRPIGLVIADYLQLISPADPRLPREQQVARISAGAKALAKDFACPLVLLAQLSRQTEQRRDARPIMSDLRESGAIENDADVVVLMHPQERGTMELHVAKNRQGERGTVEVYWQPKFMRCGPLGRDDL